MVIEASRRSNIRANLDAWAGMIPFLIPLRKKSSSPLCLNDLIVGKIVTYNVTGVNIVIHNIFWSNYSEYLNTKIDRGLPSRTGPNLGKAIL